MMNNISAEKSNPERLAGIIVLIGASRGSVTLKTSIVNLLFDECGNHDSSTLASNI